MEMNRESKQVLGKRSPSTAPLLLEQDEISPSLSTASSMDLETPLFDEYYDNWEAFDEAIENAIAKFHPLRKRSSLTFDVYNRTVSKGRHDRKNIAEFLSKTYKCTHGIKFRARGNGKRSRQNLRDLGCPFHIYASAVEDGTSYYRVKVRMNEKHNHPIGPDISGINTKYSLNDHDPNDTEDTYAYELNDTDDMTTNTEECTELSTEIDTTNTNDSEHSVVWKNSRNELSTTVPPVLLLDAFTTSNDEERNKKFEETTTFEDIRKQLAQFASERDWDQFHTPRNLLLALTGEVGELCECFQWKGDNTVVDDWTEAEKIHLGEELSDVMIYLIRLADKCNVDLPRAVADKMVKNSKKYPAEIVKGSSRKYTEYNK